MSVCLKRWNISPSFSHYRPITRRSDITHRCSNSSTEWCAHDDDSPRKTTTTITTHIITHPANSHNSLCDTDVSLTPQPASSLDCGSMRGVTSDSHHIDLNIPRGTPPDRTDSAHHPTLPLTTTLRRADYRCTDTMTTISTDWPEMMWFTTTPSLYPLLTPQLMPWLWLHYTSSRWWWRTEPAQWWSWVKSVWQFSPFPLILLPHPHSLFLMVRGVHVLLGWCQLVYDPAATLHHTKTVVRNIMHIVSRQMVRSGSDYEVMWYTSTDRYCDERGTVRWSMDCSELILWWKLHECVSHGIVMLIMIQVVTKHSQWWSDDSPWEWKLNARGEKWWCQIVSCWVNFGQNSDIKVQSVTSRRCDQYSDRIRTTPCVISVNALGHIHLTCTHTAVRGHIAAYLSHAIASCINTAARLFECIGEQEEE